MNPPPTDDVSEETEAEEEDLPRLANQALVTAWRVRHGVEPGGYTKIDDDDDSVVVAWYHIDDIPDSVWDWND